MSTPCTQSTELRSDRRDAQLLTVQRAHRAELPWTPAEDQELLEGPGTVTARAYRLGRTYYAAQWRLSQLRKRAQA